LHYVLRRWLDKKWIAGLQFRNSYHLAMVMDEDADSLREGQDPIIESKVETVWTGVGFQVSLSPSLSLSLAVALSLSLSLPLGAHEGPNLV
jgi:hypothetical protein